MHQKRQKLSLRTSVGLVDLEVWYGQDRTDGHWGNPMRERWGLSAHQQLSPVLQEKLAFTVTATTSYASAAETASVWGSPIDDSTLHELVQRLGAQAENQMQERLKTLPTEVAPPSRDQDVGVFMVDGWQVRQRGPGWGKQKTKKNRVEWHELKTGVFYFQGQATQSESGRGLLARKVVVSWQGEPLELGRRLHWQAVQRGVGRAQELVVVADGAPWIWNVALDRWPKATQVLDFYHASEHLWSLGRSLCGEAHAKEWVESRLHQLRHGKQKQVLGEIARLKKHSGQKGKAILKEQHYFAEQAKRMNYQEVANKGWPIGSGAVESACRNSQSRFKRPGQFWTQKGLRHLCALQEARQNGHWDELSFAA